MKIEYYIGKFAAWCLCHIGKHAPIRTPFMYPEDLICFRCWKYLGTDDDLRESYPHSHKGLPTGDIAWRGGRYMTPQQMEPFNID